MIFEKTQEVELRKPPVGYQVYGEVAASINDKGRVGLFTVEDYNGDEVDFLLRKDCGIDVKVECLREARKMFIGRKVTLATRRIATGNDGVVHYSYYVISTRKAKQC